MRQASFRLIRVGELSFAEVIVLLSRHAAGAITTGMVKAGIAVLEVRPAQQIMAGFPPV
jgi:hypothetical protein